VLAVLALLLLGAWGQRSLTLRGAKAAVGRVQHREALLTGRDSRYAPFAAVEADLSKRTTVVRAALASDTDAAALLDQVSANLPPDVWVQQVSVTMPGAKAVGTASFALGGVDQSSPAHWLAKMRTLGGVFSQVSLLGITADGTAHGGVHFTSQVTLAPGFVSHRGDTFGLTK